jgi:5-methylcytosine-specific restriction endonuclease McrA
MKPPKTHCNGTWTTARFFGFIRSALRRTWTRWPEQYRARHMARRPYKGKNKLQKWEFLCAECNEWFMAKNTQVHHKIECGQLKTFKDIAGFTERLLCPAENLMVLCKKCHKQKHHPKVK